MIELQFWWLIVLPVFFGLGWLAARIDIKQVLSETRSLPAVYFKGLNHLLHGEPNKAIDIYVDIAKHHAETVDLQFTLAHLFRQRGELERAIRMHQRLLSRKDLNEGQRQFATLDLAIDFMKAGLYDRAEYLLYELADTDYARQARIELLTIYQQEHEWSKAIEVASLLRDESHTYQHEIAQFNCELAANAIIHGQPDIGREYLQKALQENRQCTRARLMLGEIELEADHPSAAIQHWLAIEAQDVHYLALSARLLLRAYAKLNNEEEGEAVLLRLLRHYPHLDILDLLYERILARRGATALYEFIRERLREYPTISGLCKMLEAQLLIAPDSQKSELTMMIHLIDENMPDQNKYYCHDCGFKTRQYFWHCPACMKWETYIPIRGRRRDNQPLHSWDF